MRRILLVLAVVSMLAVRASARAGGGESYSGSSSGSSSYSYSGGSSDSGDLLGVFLYMYVRFIFQYPLVGFPLTLFI